MNILNKLNMIEEENNYINESGIRNMSALSKEYKTAEIYYHMDLDGVTSAIAIKEYLKGYGIKTIAAHKIQYGGAEWTVPKPKNKVLAVMVDFAHGKTTMKIHTDHHDAQVGVEKGTSAHFAKTPSNVEYISQVISPRDLFPAADIKTISIVDTAGFAAQDISPDDVMRAVYKTSKKLSGKANRQMMGLATNILVLAYKNKPDFLDQLVLQAKPSLLSIYNVTKKLAKENGYKPPEEVESGKMAYVGVQATKIKTGDLNTIKSLKNGEQVMIGNTIVQYGGGSMFKGYDRYTPFKNNPDADFLLIAWPMGLIQASVNPFKKSEKKIHLGNLVMKKVMPKFKSKLEKKIITLDTLKFMFERDIKDNNAMGFTFKDLIALFEKQLKGLAPKGTFRDMIQDITNKPHKSLSFKQKNILKKVTITAWDLIMASSGGHPSITNISGLNFLGKNYTIFMKEMMVEIAKEMKDL